MKKAVKAAGIQIAPTLDKKETLSRARGLIELAAEKGASIVCLPQLFSSPWFPSGIAKENFSFAEEENGETISEMRDIAKKKGIIIIAPIFEKDSADYFNTCFVIGSKGEIIGKYRKIHVPQIPLWEEKSYFKPGNLGFPVFQTPFGKIGVLICWDVFFPEAFRMLALNGAEIVFTPTASAFFHSRFKWERAIAAAAHANGFFVFRVNRIGKETRQEFYGRSFCAGPDGEFILKPVGSSEGIVIADMDLGMITEARSEWAFLKDFRPECYKDITER